MSWGRQGSGNAGTVQKRSNNGEGEGEETHCTAGTRFGARDRVSTHAKYEGKPLKGLGQENDMITYMSWDNHSSSYVRNTVHGGGGGGNRETS